MTMTKQTYISGWDIGGAHLKVARCDSQGQLIQVIELPCPLWKGIIHLQSSIKLAQQQLANKNDLAAITMTGELVDIFPNRQAGVTQILDCINEFIPDRLSHVYAGEKAWLSPSEAKINWQNVASRNWQATASFAAKKIHNGLLIDIGSTTCDIIPLKDGEASPTAFTDHHRQLSAELLYTGAIRTPLIALTNKAVFNGQQIGLAAEIFATTADCWVLLNQLDSNSINDTSADAMPWTDEDCARRMARLLGTDAHDHSASQWRQLAQWFAQQQIQAVINACLQVLSAHPTLENTPIVAAGIGRFIAKKCAEALERDYIDFNSLISSQSDNASDHAPAVAVALLASQQLT